MMMMRLYYQVMFTRALCLTDIDIEIEILFRNDSSILLQSYGNARDGTLSKKNPCSVEN